MTTFVDPPPVAPARFGLLEAASVVTGGDPHRDFGVSFETNCGIAHLTLGACVAASVGSGSSGESDGDPVGQGEKVVDDGIDYIDSLPFAVYHLFGCRNVGGWAGAEARARASFEKAEGRAVEEFFGHWLTTESGAVDLSGGAAVPLADGLAMLEEYAGSVYSGQPIIHADRAAASLLFTAGAVERVGPRMETGLGALVAAGSGYALGNPDGTTPTATGEGWLYVTGAVGVWRGEVLATDNVPTLSVPAPLVAAAARATTSATNEFKVLVERPYSVATECFQAAIRVTKTSCGCEEVPT